MKVVAGCPVAERSWVIQEWIDSLRSQQLDPGDELEIVCVYTRSRDDTLDILQRNDVGIIDSPLPTRSYERMVQHAWSYIDHEYEVMAKLRNDLRKEAVRRNADYFLSIDSDILFTHEDDLRSMIYKAPFYSANAVAPLVNMQKDVRTPPAWNFMHLVFNGAGADRVDDPDISTPFLTGVIMAAMLLDRTAQMIPWRNHPQGEDIGWSIKAHFAGLKLLVDTSVTCTHRMSVHEQHQV